MAPWTQTDIQPSTDVGDSTTEKLTSTLYTTIPLSTTLKTTQTSEVSTLSMEDIQPSTDVGDSTTEKLTSTLYTTIPLSTTLKTTQTSEVTTLSMEGCKSDADTDRPGSDINVGSDLPVANPQACCDACTDRVGCVAWTFQKKINYGNCWLKNQVPNPVPNTCCESGYVDKTSTILPHSTFLPTTEVLTSTEQVTMTTEVATTQACNTAVTCPIDWLYLCNNDRVSCYKIGSDSQDWNSARVTCENAHPGGDLVKIENQTEQDFITAQMFQVSVAGCIPLSLCDVWIGVSFTLSTGYTYADGTSVTYFNWNTPIEPNGGTADKCVQMGRTTGLWDDRECSGLRRYACEIEGTEGYDFELWMCKESAGEAHLLNCMCPHSAKIPKLFNRTTSYEVSLNYRITIYDNSSDSYFCLVQYSGGKWPHITEQPENITVSAGASSTLRCESSGFPPPHIKWMKSGHELGFFDNSRFVTMSSDDVSWLNINETLPQDEGVYNCIATNILGQATSTDAELTVMTDAMPTGELLIEPPDQPELSMGMIFAVIGGSLAVVIMIISGIICYIRRRHRKQIVHIHGNVSANNFTVNAENDAAVRILGDVAIGHENLGDKLEAEADVNLNNLKQ
uniref:Uncharacterized protein LOC102804845 n=1 Tax=Saccoglossus kowalevskii TaxID=10224 RepID=A0ABM0MXP3_SACKO|nr:PREDICTED: uncharacterized protein LOC102804845 [Saccoglossus kowalevskii]